MKFETLHKSKALKSIMTNFFVILDACQYWDLSILAPVILLVTVLDEKWQIFQFWLNFVLCTNRVWWIQWWQYFFCDSWCLPILTIVSIGTYYLLGHSFQPKIANAPALIKFSTLLKIKTWNWKTNLVSKKLLLHYKQNW